MFHGTLSKACIKPTEQVLFYVEKRKSVLEIMPLRKYKYLHHSSADNESLSKVISLLIRCECSPQPHFSHYFCSSLTYTQIFLFLKGSPCGSFYFSVIYKHIFLENYTTFLLFLVITLWMYKWRWGFYSAKE